MPLLVIFSVFLWDLVASPALQEDNRLANFSLYFVNGNAVNLSLIHCPPDDLLCKKNKNDVRFYRISYGTQYITQ